MNNNKKKIKKKQNINKKNFILSHANAASFFVLITSFIFYLMDYVYIVTFSHGTWFFLTISCFISIILLLFFDRKKMTKQYNTRIPKPKKKWFIILDREYDPYKNIVRSSFLSKQTRVRLTH